MVVHVLHARFDFWLESEEDKTPREQLRAWLEARGLVWPSPDSAAVSCWIDPGMRRLWVGRWMGRCDLANRSYQMPHVFTCDATMVEEAYTRAFDKKPVIRPQLFLLNRGED